jgi:hypothetical protein
MNKYDEGYIQALEEVMHEMILQTRTPRHWLIFVKEKIDHAKRCLK